MREQLSKLLVRGGVNNPLTMVLSGDHGYALFDELRSALPNQFLNVGVMEQAMVGIAAGLAKVGFRPIVYGLSSFIPIRVLEQIKMDLCHPKLPVILLGDGAGLVYSTLGASHQCGEDVAVLRAMPQMTILTPADEFELEACFDEAVNAKGPSYIRIGKSDRQPLLQERVSTTAPRHLLSAPPGRPTIIAMGSMSSVGYLLGKEFGLGFVSVLRVKPLHESLVRLIDKIAERNQSVLILEEHSRFGGLASTITDALVDAGGRLPRMSVWSLKDKFVESCGTYQHALSEHDMDDEQIRKRLDKLLKGNHRADLD